MNVKFLWQLTNKNILVVKLNYTVFGRRHALQFYFLVIDGGTINPVKLTAFFRDFFITEVFSSVVSSNLVWNYTQITHLEGQIKVLEEQMPNQWPILEGALAQTPDTTTKPQNPADLDNRLRISFNRYNLSNSIYFYIYGIQKNLDAKKLGKLVNMLFDMTQEDIVINQNKNPANPQENPEQWAQPAKPAPTAPNTILGSISLRFVGLTNATQVSENHFVVGVTYKLSKRQNYKNPKDPDTL